MFVRMCVYVCVLGLWYRELPTQQVEAWLFSLLINIQCGRFVTLFISSLSSLPITLFQVSHRPSSPTRLFWCHCFHYHPLILSSSLSFSHALPISFAHSGNTLSRRIRYSRFLRTFVARESLRRSGARVFVRAFVQMDDIGGKTRAPFVEKSVNVHPGRASQNQNVARSGWTTQKETSSFSRYAVVELGRGDPR